MKPVDGNDYEALIDSFEIETLFVSHDDDYQGDSRYLFRDGERYGLLIFGWGSCSGCDAYEAAAGVSMAAVTELRDELWGDVHWEPSKEALISYILNKDWNLDYSGHNEETKLFLKQAPAVLRGEHSPQAH